MTAHIEAQDLSHKYGETPALRKVNLAVEKGEVTALIGANGSGKTTLLKIMSGLEAPSEGSILLQGEPADCKTLRKISTMVFQKTTVFNMSVYDNVAYGLKARGIGRHEIDSKVSKALKLVGLEGFEKRRARKLSGGEQQRVSLARALILEPDILLLDEPTANIDPRNASIIESVITRVNRDLGTTIIMASHNIGQARLLASKVAALQAGVLVSLGSAIDILGKPSDILESVGRLQNIFSGQALPTQGDLTLIDIGDGVKLEAAEVKEGPVTVFIKPEDIIISKMPLLSSARNILKGRISEASDWNGLIRLKVDAGKEFLIAVTRKSFEEMQLNLNSEVYLTFKAQAVHIIAS